MSEIDCFPMSSSPVPISYQILPYSFNIGNGFLTIAFHLLNNSHHPNVLTKYRPNPISAISTISSLTKNI